MTSRNIDYFFSMPSPWAYLGHAPFMAIAKRHDLGVRFRPVKLGAVFAETGGLPLGQRHPARQRIRLVELQRWRDHRKVPLNVHPAHWPFAADLPDGFVLAVIETGTNPDAILREMFAACWAREEDINDPATLSALGDRHGLDGRALVEAASSDSVMATYAANARDGIASEIIGSPAYVLDGEVFWGQDKLILLDEALDSSRAPYRPIAKT